MGSYGTDYEKLTVSTSVVSLDADKVAVASKAVIFVESSTSKYARFLYCAQDPTTANGNPVTNGQSFDVEGLENLQNFRAIRANDEDVTFHVNYESFNPDDAPTA